MSLTLIQVASLSVGACIGITSVFILAVTLRGVEESNQAAIRNLYGLIYLLLGSGIGDYVIFDLMLRGHAIEFYMIGTSASFFVFAVPMYLDFRRK